MQSAQLLDAVRPPRMRPVLWHALADLSRRRDDCLVHHETEAWRDFVRRHRAFRGEWARTPELGAVGLGLLDPRNAEHVRVLACVWLTEFPSAETVAALAAIATDEREPARLRDQAAWTLGFRQLQESDDALLWPPDAVAAADRTLLALWQSPARTELPELAHALRHVACPELLDAFAEDVVAAAPALEAFATPRLAQALLARLAELPSEDAPRIVRLVADTLGAAAVPELLARTERAPLAVRTEALFAGLALDAPRARPAFEAFVAPFTFDRVLRARAAFHAARPGLVPAVRALRIARTTAVLPREERSLRCREVGADLAALAAVEPFAESYLYAILRHLAFRARDDALVVAAAEATPSSLADGPFLVRPYLEALARAGRFDRLCETARTHAATAQATWLLATHGRPFAALGMQRLATEREPEACAGGALALFLAGRPDLAERALAREPPRAANVIGVGVEPFPGPDERHCLAHEPERWPALVALAGGVPTLLAATRGAPAGADPDPIDFALLAERDKDLRTDIAGATVCVIGRCEHAPALRTELEARGARLVDGPFARTDYFVAAPGADPAAVGRLRALGVRELRLP